ncbi:FtsX-like permease family protein [Paenibacillus pini]
MILKRKREFGILKATGYTTFQLMTQIAMSFVPIVIIGYVQMCIG